MRTSEVIQGVGCHAEGEVGGVAPPPGDTIWEQRCCIDRSPAGTGRPARMAVLHARGQMQVGDRYRARSIIRSGLGCGIGSSMDLSAAIRYSRDVCQVWAGDG